MFVTAGDNVLVLEARSARLARRGEKPIPHRPGALSSLRFASCGGADDGQAECCSGSWW
jgi:hypothetical protein